MTAAFCSPAGTTVSYAEAWQQVSAKNDTLAAARANVEQAKYKRDAAKDLYFPEVGISATYLYLDDQITLSPEDILESTPAGDQLAPIIAGLATSYGLSVTELNSGLTSTIAERENLTSSIRAQWPIYTGGRIDAAQDIALGKLGEANHELEKKLEEQFDYLARSYFGVVLAKRVLDTKVYVETGLKKHRDNAILLEKKGQIARVERLQADASHVRATVDRHKAERELEIARLALTRLLKSSRPVIPSDALFINDTMPPLATFLDKTLAYYPGLGVLESKKEQATGLIAVEKGKYLPTVAVFGNYILYEKDDLATKLVPDWIVGVGLSIPLFDRSGRSGNLAAAKSMVKQIDALQLQAQSDLSVLVEKSYHQTKQAIEEYKGLESSLILAEETVELRVKAFNQGLSTSLDVVDAELFRADIKTQRAVAAYKYVVTLAKLYAISGQLDSFLLYQNRTEVR
ncbi:TolC family protein [Desulfopila inferna]|uniref:TolC family protein n=1 Tax=Desulfopila inferna TaxID=468528 RepID=UPI0019628DC2|nr:TolC family protein [Desulfopila inferna]MBM9605916.1 TolC family protein [Desulfopila inferna]